LFWTCWGKRLGLPDRSGLEGTVEEAQEKGVLREAEKHFKDGPIGFAVLYEKSEKIRLLIEKALRETFRPPCGRDVFE